MAGLFSSNEQDMLGTIMQQRGQSNQALGSGYGKYGGIVQAGAGMADIGGDAMFGGATGASDPRMIEQQEVKAIFSQAATQTGNSTSPEFYMAFSELLAAKFPEQSQKAMEQAQKVKNEAEDRAMAKEKHDFDLNTDNAQGAGTGPERMIMFVGSIRRRLAKGEEVPEDQIAQAEDFRTFLAQNKVYADKEGNVVNVTTSQLSPIRPLNSKGAATQGSQSGQSTPPTGSTTTSNGMTVATNINTPQALKAQKQVADKRRTLKASFTDGLGLLNEIIDNSDWTTRGLGGDLASLNPYSESSSQRRTQQTIIAKLVTETLADLKSQSATGATGFGALNEAELQIIKDQITNLNPSDPNYDKRLLALRDRWEKAIALIDQEAGSNNRESASKPQDLSQFDTPN